MAITYEEALETLKSMFGDPWTESTLDAVLRHHEGHMENTVETVLAHGDGDPDELVRRLQDPTAAAAAVAAAAATSNNSGASTPVTANGGGGGSSRATRTRGGRRLRGIRTELPPDFLRIPGVDPPPGTDAPDIDADEQLARMLQDELFTQELRNNPEFAHLAGTGGPHRGGGAGRAGGGPGGGLGFPGSRRTTGAGATGSAAATANAQPPLGPAVMDRLGEMGENAKKRLTLFARNFNDRMHERAQAQGGVGGIVGGPGVSNAAAASTGAERRGLLDLELGEDDDEEISFQEMGNVGGGGGGSGGKKND